MIGRRAQGLTGAATGRCDTHATGGSRRESYQPGRAGGPTGEYQGPPPARDKGNQIPSAQPGKYAAPGLGNRYLGTGQHRPTQTVTVIR